MKKHVMGMALAAASLGLLPAASQATLISGFTGPYASGSWVTTTTGNLPGGDRGSATFISTQLTLVGGDDPTVDPNSGIPACTGATTGLLSNCQITTTHGKVGASDTISFNWSYTTADISPETDIFGIIVDGVVTELSAPGGALTQSGSQSVSSTSSFAFFVNCTDCVGGAATATISAFQVAVVPEPETMVLLGLGVVAIYASRQRRRSPRRGMLFAA